MSGFISGYAMLSRTGREVYGDGYKNRRQEGFAKACALEESAVEQNANQRGNSIGEPGYPGYNGNLR